LSEGCAASARTAAVGRGGPDRVAERLTVGRATQLAASMAAALPEGMEIVSDRP